MRRCGLTGFRCSAVPYPLHSGYGGRPAHGWNLWGPEREPAASRIESEKVAGIYNALTGDPALKSRVANAHVKVWISHTASDSYALQAGDECALYLSFTAEYDSDEAFPQTARQWCRPPMQTGGLYDLLLQLV